MQKTVNYQLVWGRIYILFGLLFGLLFIFGALILADFTILFNLIAAFIVSYIGYAMLKRPYARYSETTLVVYGFTGAVRKQYSFTSTTDIVVKQNKLYLHGKKLKINSWIVDKADWKRLIQFFENDSDFIEELRDD